MSASASNTSSNITKLDEIKVVSAAGYEQTIADAPASVFVITSEDLERTSHNDITDVLRGVPGVTVVGGGAMKDISIRGMGADYTLYLIDGKPLSSNEAHSPNGAGGGIVGGMLPPLSMIERIEVVRGPMSSLYGSEAMGGVVNIITKRIPSSPSGSIGTEYTKSFNDITNNAYQTNVALSTPLIDDTLSLQIDGSLLKLDESDKTGGADSSASTPSTDRRTAGAKLVWALNDQNSIYLDYDYSKNLRVRTPGKSIADTAARSQNLAKRDIYSLGHDAKYEDFVINSYAQYTKTKNNRANANTLKSGIDYDVLVLNTQGTYFAESNAITLGAQYKYEELDDKVTNTLPSSFNSYPTLDKWQYAIFAEDEWRVIDDLAITVGARLNDDEKFGVHVTPRIYAVYNLTPDLVVKGGVSTGYKQPTLRQSADDFGSTTGQGSAISLGNPDLKPEKSTNYELSSSYSNKDLGLNFSATAFFSQFKDKISEFRECQSSSGITGARECSYGGEMWSFVSTRINVDKAELYGLELSAAYAPIRELMLRATYTYQRSEQKTGAYAGMALSNMPKTLASISAEYQALAKLGVWAQANYQGTAAYYTSSRGGANTATNKAYTLVDIGLNYDFTKETRLSMGIYNLFNKEIDNESFGKFIDGRRVSVGIYANF
jgi:outer membrane receptor for ferrienterochelin and colicins